MLISGPLILLWNLKCQRCHEVCYVSQTRRHLQVRVSEHFSKKGTVETHLKKCVRGITEDSVDLLGFTIKGEVHLLRPCGSEK